MDNKKQEKTREKPGLLRYMLKGLLVISAYALRRSLSVKSWRVAAARTR
jgi:hypothetical protein